MNLSIIGLGKLGACTAACFANKGFNVIGVDVNEDFVNSINSGKAPVFEPSLQNMIDNATNRLMATLDFEYALLNSDITFLIVPTPSNQDGEFSDRYLKDALQQLATAFKKKDSYHIFVITSTVSPGTTEKSLIPLIKSVSKKKLNKDFGICYNPEFIALGSVVRDFLNPDMVLIGESDAKAGNSLEEIYNAACDNKPYIARMSLISAEITKISLNVYLTMKISFANTLANICEKIPGADVDAISRALGSDKRISPHFLKGGLSYGGPCFPRDGRAFVAFAQQHKINAELARATNRVNLFQINHLAEVVLDNVNNDDYVAVVGLAYKPNTPVIEESAAITLIQNLLAKKLRVIVYDSLAISNVKARFGQALIYASSLRECIASSNVCVITNSDSEFRAIDESYMTANTKVIIDCWRILDPAKLGQKVKYICLGKANVHVKQTLPS